MPLAFFYVLQSQIKEVLCDWEPQGSTQYNVQYGEAPPKRGTFCKFQLYKRVEMSLAEIYERAGKRYGLVIYSHLKDSSFTAVEREAKFKLLKVCKRHQYHLPIEGIRKGTFPVKNGI